MCTCAHKYTRKHMISFLKQHWDNHGIITQGIISPIGFSYVRNIMMCRVIWGCIYRLRLKCSSKITLETLYFHYYTRKICEVWWIEACTY